MRKLLLEIFATFLFFMSLGAFLFSDAADFRLDGLMGIGLAILLWLSFRGVDKHGF